MTFDLTTWLSASIYDVLLVFVRISAAFMLLPGFGEPSVPVRIRILVGVAIAAAVAASVPDMPTTVPGSWGIVLAVIAEGVSGALIGTLARTVISGVLTAGQVIGQNIGLSNIFATGIVLDQAASIGATVYAGLLAVLFASGGHHAILRALVQSYALLPAGQFPNIDASTHAVIEAGLRGLQLSLQLAFPFLMLAFVFNIALAAINRALPAIPVFMIGAPAIVIAGLYLLAATVPGLLNSGMAGWSNLPSLLLAR